MKSTKKRCDGCDTRLPSGKVFCILTQQNYDICDKCRPAIVKGNIKESCDVMYKALQAAVKHGGHDHRCDHFSPAADLGDKCDCWYGPVVDTLDKVDGKLKGKS